LESVALILPLYILLDVLEDLDLLWLEVLRIALVLELLNDIFYDFSEQIYQIRSFSWLQTLDRGRIIHTLHHNVKIFVDITLHYLNVEQLKQLKVWRVALGVLGTVSWSLKLSRIMNLFRHDSVHLILIGLSSIIRLFDHIIQVLGASLPAGGNGVCLSFELAHFCYSLEYTLRVTITIICDQLALFLSRLNLIWRQWLVEWRFKLLGQSVNTLRCTVLATDGEIFSNFCLKL